jgi:hypothetical protein
MLFDVLKNRSVKLFFAEMLKRHSLPTEYELRTIQLILNVLIPMFG